MLDSEETSSMRRGTYRPRNSNVPEFLYDGGIGRNALRNAIQAMMSDPARRPKPTPVRREPKKKIVVHGKRVVSPLLTY